MIRTIRKNGWFTAWLLWGLFLWCCHKIIGELPKEIICLEFIEIFLSWLWEFCWLCGHTRRKMCLRLSTCGFWFCCHSCSTFLLCCSARLSLRLALWWCQKLWRIFWLCGWGSNILCVISVLIICSQIRLRFWLWDLSAVCSIVNSRNSTVLRMQLILARFTFTLWFLVLSLVCCCICWQKIWEMQNLWRNRTRFIWQVLRSQL